MRPASRHISTIAATALNLLALVLWNGGAAAGELTVGWSAIGSQPAAQYRIYIGTAPGVYDRIETVGPVFRASIQSLPDNQMHYFAVKAFDAEGHESPSFSPELASLPAPRIEAMEPSGLMPGQRSYVRLSGANFEAGSQVHAVRPHLNVLSAVSLGPDQLILLLEADPADTGSPDQPIALGAADFAVINSGRKADEFFEFHPEVADLDGDRRVDTRDLDIVTMALGASQGEARYTLTADLDGNGIVDGQDLLRVSAKLTNPAD